MIRKDKVDSPNHTEYSLVEHPPWSSSWMETTPSVPSSCAQKFIGPSLPLSCPSSKWLQRRGRPRSHNLRDQPLTSMTSFKRNDELAHTLHARWFAAARVPVRTRSPPEALFPILRNKNICNKIVVLLLHVFLWRSSRHLKDLFPTLRNKDIGKTIVGLSLQAHLNGLLEIEGTGEATKHPSVCGCMFSCGRRLTTSTTSFKITSTRTLKCSSVVACVLFSQNSPSHPSPSKFQELECPQKLVAVWFCVFLRDQRHHLDALFLVFGH